MSMLKKLWNRILFSAPVRAMIRIADSIRPWGFEGLSLFYVMRFFVEEDIMAEMVFVLHSFWSSMTSHLR